jgi:hypothetical protein
MLLTDGTTRTYDYSTSSIYKESQNIKSASPSGVYKYLGGSTYKDDNNVTYTIGSSDTSKSYTYRNLKIQNANYYVGYYMGNIYYNGVKSDNDVKVETRVDQYVDYVDQDLVFKTNDNENDEGNITYLTYSISEIASKGLMSGVTSSTNEITDGEKAYCDLNNEVNNNLAFSIEDGTVNSKLYKYLYASSLYDGDIENSLYMIDLEASRTLSSESLNGVIIDNLAEIVKVSNTVGRKAYVIRNSSTGYIGDSAKQIGAYSTKLEAGLLETDTDFTEYVTFSPPTGLSKVELVKLEVENNVVRTVEIVIAILVLVTSGISIIRISRKKKFYK